MHFDIRLRKSLMATVSAGVLASGIAAHANPADPNVVAGDVSISGLGTDHVVVDNNSMRAIVDWGSFSIGPGEVTTINQISSDAAILNRVVGGNVTEIYGRLESNGQVFLINESGILVGETGVIDTNGFVASTLNLSNIDFLNGGDLLFRQGVEAGNGITVHGKIRSVSGGDIFLLSREIEIGEKAVIDANGGYVGLAAGEEILLRPADSGDGRISIRAGKGRIVNRGTISGVAAELRAAGGNPYALAINNTGVVRATGVVRRGGRILLTGGGAVRNAGRLHAQRKVVVRSRSSIVNKGEVRAATAEEGGEIVFEAPEIVIENGSLLDVSAALGGGRMFIGGGYQGSQAARDGTPVDIAVNARSVNVQAGALLKADATQAGDGGEIIVWADGITEFHGDISARALGASGDGGFAEVSGGEHLRMTGHADLRAANGRFGTLLLDPGTVTIQSGGGANTGPDTFDDAYIVTQLGLGNVTIATSNAGTGPEDINITAGVRIIWNGDTLLTLKAGRDINAIDDVVIQNTETGDGTNTFVTGNGGVRFLAGRDINIGGATGRTGGVVIGSEFGQNTFVAGDTNFDGTPDAAGNVVLSGGDADGAYAHVGYRLNTRRGNDTGNDFASAGQHAANGTIVVKAGGSVQLQGGSGEFAFAQIGHGGVRFTDPLNAQTIRTAAETVADIVVEAGVATAATVRLGNSQNAVITSYAQIGHGALLANGQVNASDNALVHGNISGNITVTVRDGTLLLNDSFTASQNLETDVLQAQIGSGGHLFYTGVGTSGVEVTHGKIQGDITLDVAGGMTLGTRAQAPAASDQYWITSLVGHGGTAVVKYAGGLLGGTNSDRKLSIAHERIATFENIVGGSQTTNISVTAGSITVLAEEETQNSSTLSDFVADNVQRSQIGHGMASVAMSDVAVPDGSLDVEVIEGDISGNISVTEDDAAVAGGITVAARITGTDQTTSKDAMIARIGHASQAWLRSPDGGVGLGATALNQPGGDGFDGGDIVYTQAHVLGASIALTTTGAEGDDQDIRVAAEVKAAQNSVELNTAIAQIGHGGDALMVSGDGGAGAKGNGIGRSGASGSGGDITVYKGTVWDGIEHDGNVSYGGAVGISITSSNQVSVVGSTAAGSARAERNNAQARIGSGHFILVATGDGGSAPAAAAGGRGGDIYIDQRIEGRDYGGADTGDDDTARGVRGAITISAVNTATADHALEIVASDAAATAGTGNNTARSQLGHGDIIEAVTGDGGDGGNANAENQAPLDSAGNTVQPESFGGRGGHIKIDLSDMLIESDIRADIQGAVRIAAVAQNATKASERNIVEAFMGHGQYIQAHAGDGGQGGDADFLANASPVFATASAQEQFLADFQNQSSSSQAIHGGGAARGGNGGDIEISFGDITDRRGDATNGFFHDDEADVQLVITGNNTTDVSLVIQAQITHAQAEGIGDDVAATLGHRLRVYGEGGIGGDGGHTRVEFDDFIQPDTSGGRGGDVRITTGNVRGDVIADMPREAQVKALGGNGAFTKVLSLVGHSTDVVAVAQKGGNGGDQNEDVASGCIATPSCADGGIEDADQTNPSVSRIVLLDGNDDDEFDLTGVNDANSTVGEDGIDIDGDGQAETFASIAAHLGNNPAGTTPGSTDDVIFHDEEGDPQFILDNNGKLVPNNAANNASYAALSANIARFGRQVGTYEADLGVNNDLPRFVDLDQDGDVDLVDFDADGRIDIVDLDKNGVYDKIDGRAAFGSVAGAGGFNIMDYTVVSGLAPDVPRHREGGWTLQNRYDAAPGDPTPSDTIAANGSIRDHTDDIAEVGRALVGDFSTANGGRGGDARVTSGFVIGDVEIDTGSDNRAANNTNSLQVYAELNDGINATGGSADIVAARIGHHAFSVADTGAQYTNRAAGRVESADGTAGHVKASGGTAGRFAINASGGRGGDASIVQGAGRDNDPRTNVTVTENDHLVGDIYVNVTDDEQPNDLRVGRASASDARVVSIEAVANADAGTGVALARIGHGAVAAAYASAVGGNGASDNDATSTPGTTSQTEIADGGRGGEASVEQYYIKGDIFLQAGEDDKSGNDVSLRIRAVKQGQPPAGDEDMVLAGIGHGRLGSVSAGKGGAGDDGQWRGNGGRGGDAYLRQWQIRDSLITIDLVDKDDGYYGNGMLVEAVVQVGGDHTVRAQVGHGDMGFALSGSGGSATAADGSRSWVIEQINQKANGGRGGDATIIQQGYAHDIIVDVGPNLSAPDADALQVMAHVDTADAGTGNHVLASIGHGGLANADSSAGGDGGVQDTTFALSYDIDPNRRDGIDPANGMPLGTDRSGGRGGHAKVVMYDAQSADAAYVGSDTGDRGNLDYGRTDRNGADIIITVHDDLKNNAAAGDGVLVQARSGKGSNREMLTVTTAVIGHHAFGDADASGGTGGSGIQGDLASGRVSLGDGGDGGDGWLDVGVIQGDISVSNDLDGALSNAGNNADTDIVVEAVDQSANDSQLHRAEARIGHLAAGEVLGGNGGNAAREDGPTPSFPATISARGGDGGDATVLQRGLKGDITLTAEDSIEIRAQDSNASSEMLVAAAGHRLEVEAAAGNGGEGGTAIEGDQNLYFIYEALREYATYRQAGDSHATAVGKLSAFERKLIEPIVSDYFEDKSIDHFLRKMVLVPATTGSGGSYGANVRDDNYIGNTDYSVPALTAEEKETLLFLMAATGDGGHTTVRQGYNGPSVSGDITLNALARDLTDTTRGILVQAKDGGPNAAFEVAHVGHQAEVVRAHAGNAADIKAHDDSMGGDGGNVLVVQEAFDGRITLDSEHKITIEAVDGTVDGARQRAWIGHRLTIGPDRPEYRVTNVVQAGTGGSGTDTTDNSRNGNGGNVLIIQKGAVTRDNGPDIDILLLADNRTSAQDPADHVSVRILASSTGAGSQEAEVHLGHDMLIASVKAGDAGHREPLKAPEGLDEGVREGNGGDIGIIQGDIGADIDIVARDTVDIDAVTALAANDAHVIIGHERTIGEIADTDNDTASRAGTIVAGMGGASLIEDYNDTAEIDSWVTGVISKDYAFEAVTGATTDVEDADAGSIYISTGTLGGSQASGDDAEVITILSLYEDVTINAVTGQDGRARVEIGLQQQVHAQTLEASFDAGDPNARTAGDGGDIRITRGAITGDILIAAIDQDHGSGGGSNADDQGVLLDAATGTGGTAEVLVGHEAEYGDATTQGGNPESNDALGFGDPGTSNTGTAISTSAGSSGVSRQSAGFGEDRFSDLDNALAGFINLAAAGSGTAGEATLRDANDALEDIHNVLRVIAMANQYADRYRAADAARLAQAQTDAQAAYNDAEAAMQRLIAGTASKQATVAALQAAARKARQALQLAHDTVVNATDGAGNSLNASRQIADQADAGDILYTGADALQGGTVANEGLVSGNVTLISGRDTNNDNAADTFDAGFVQVTSQTGSGGQARSQLGHRRSMSNVTGQGGGDTDGTPEDGGVAGDGGSITITSGNRTEGNVLIKADEVIARAKAGSGGAAETHLGHDVEVVNFADQSDIEGLMGNGGSIVSRQVVAGDVTILANHVSSSEDAGNSILGADSGSAKALLHLGHQVDSDDDSRSDRTIGGTGGDEANRGGSITTTQSVSGDIHVSLDLDGDGNPADLTIQTLGSGSGDTRLGHWTGQDAFSGDPTDDGGRIEASQTVTGSVLITDVEDLLVEASGTGDNDTYLGHDAYSIAQSGDVNGATGDEYGEAVKATQTVTGEIAFYNGSSANRSPIRSFTLRTEGNVTGEAHVGHEANLVAKSADDTAHPSDGKKNDGIGGNAFDVDASQLVQAEVSVIAGEVLLDAGGSGSREAERGVQLGHEAFIVADVDGGRPDAVVRARSYINPDDASAADADDIVVTATTSGIPANDDTLANVVSPTGVDGDITVRDSGAGASEAQIGHRSHSRMSHAVGNQPTGAFDALQAIGGTDADKDGLIDLQTTGTGAGTLVADTSETTITINAERDLNVLDQKGGVAQIGHFIVEKGTPLHSTGAVQEKLADNSLSQIRQIVGSDIVIGDGTPASTTGVGNNLVMKSNGGRAEIGHRSSGDNEWQITGTNVITPQVLDGDIIIEVGVDSGGVINGAAPGDTAAGGDDDALLDASAGGVVRIGHNHAAQAEAAANETQVSGGDIWLRVRSDLHVKAAAIGHEHYQHDTTAGTVNKETAVGGLGTERNRIHGKTTIGAGQNSPQEDSVLTANVMKFDGSAGAVSINSGYGGQGNADVDGELRFFLPAQQNLTIVNPVRFNDSVGSGDAPRDRTADASNIFLGNGGVDHEHDFELMDAIAVGTTRPYTDTFIGRGNYTFYFERTPTGQRHAADVYYTPRLEIIDLYPSDVIVVYRGRRANGTVNMGVLRGREHFGTSTQQLLCEQLAQGNLGNGCGEVFERHRVFGLPVEFKGAAGGNRRLPAFRAPAVEAGAVGTGGGRRVTARLQHTLMPAAPGQIVVRTARQQPQGERPTFGIAFTRGAQRPQLQLRHTARGNLGEVLQGELTVAYGEYITNPELASRQMRAAFPGALAAASSFELLAGWPR